MIQFWKRKERKPKPQLLHVKDENQRIAFTIKTHEGDLTKELIEQALDRARSECVGPPIYLNLVYHDGSNLGINRKIDTEGVFPYWAGHKPGTPEVSPADRFLRKVFHRWVKPYYPDELVLAEQGKW